MKLFERYDKVYVINLKKRKDRLNNFIDQVVKHDLGEFQVFEAFEGGTLNVNSNLLSGEKGIIRSVIGVIEDAMLNDYSKILIVEDDCEFNENLKNIETYYSNLPNNWDMLYFGGNHNIHVNSVEPEKINDYVAKLSNTYAAHCIAIKKDMFKVILESIKNYHHPLDVSYHHLQKYFNIYGFYPGIAYQKPNFSDIQKQFTDYTWLIK